MFRTTIRVNGKDMHLELWHTKYECRQMQMDNDDLWEFYFEEFLNGAIEVNEDILYWYADGRVYETVTQIG